MEKYKGLPLLIDGGKWNTGHVQGIALDTAGKYVYYAFTTTLVKTDLEGNLIGTVTGLLGHLGCIDFNDDDGRLYGSLELKHDSIGQGIMKHTGQAIAEEDSFYIAIFDVDKIDRVGMDAERDGVMKAVYLGEVVDDYNATDACGKAHRYGCSGVDGTGFGPVPGSPAGSPNMLFIAYGIYGELDREDNDYQVLLCFDWRRFDAYAQPLTQGHPHHSGPRPDAKYFLYTGNTTWGIQNLEYDAFTGDWCVAVYVGKKPQFPNYPMFVIDGSVAPVETELVGRGGERGMVLSLKKEGNHHEESGVWGLTFKRGQTGMYSFGNGLFYVSHEGRTPEPERLHTCTVHLYRRLPGDAVGFAEITGGTSEGSDDPDPAQLRPQSEMPPRPNYISVAKATKTPATAPAADVAQNREKNQNTVPAHDADATADSPAASAAPVAPTATVTPAAPAEPGETPVLEIRHLSKKFGARRVLNDISLTVGRGEIFGFLGPNGSGKTTTIKLMLGLLNLEQGEIFICGHNVRTDFEAAMSHVGGIIENPEMYRYLSGRQNLEQYARMYGGIPEERIDRLAALVGLEGRLNDKIARYSLGMRQRLGLAQALLNNPALIVLDEPTNGLDPEGIHDLRETLIGLAAQGVSVFVSSHQLSELEQLCTHVGIISRGTLLGVQSMAELRRLNDPDSTTMSVGVRSPEAAAGILSRRGIGHTVTDGALRFTLPNDLVCDVLCELANGAGLLSAVPEQRSLEQAFLEMTHGYDIATGQRPGKI